VEVSQEVVSGWQETLERFFARRTKQELYEGALQHRVMLFPVLELSDILENRQMEARQFFRPFPAGDGRHAAFPGSFFRAVEGADPSPAPPPRLGEHTNEVLTDLGYGSEELLALRTAGVIG
jgi:crotonobetainyl-CoA:carnitine CoA-transferase CaiB-like acyl-CoA transferase